MILYPLLLVLLHVDLTLGSRFIRRSVRSSPEETCLSSEQMLQEFLQSNNFIDEDTITSEVKNHVREEASTHVQNFECRLGFYGDECLPCDCPKGYQCHDRRSGDGSCTCLSDHYGPECLACDCNHFPCEGGLEGSGACLCPSSSSSWNSTLCRCPFGYHRDLQRVTPVGELISSGHDVDVRGLRVWNVKSSPVVRSEGLYLEAPWVRVDLFHPRVTLSALRYRRWMPSDRVDEAVPHVFWVFSSDTAQQGTWTLWTQSVQPYRAANQIARHVVDNFFEHWIPLPSASGRWPRYLLVALDSPTRFSSIPLHSLDVWEDTSPDISCVPVEVPLHSRSLLNWPPVVLPDGRIPMNVSGSLLHPESSLDAIFDSALETPSDYLLLSTGGFIQVDLEHPFYVSSIVYQRRLYSPPSIPWSNAQFAQNVTILGRSNNDLLWRTIGFSTTSRSLLDLSDGFGLSSVTTLGFPHEPVTSLRWVVDHEHYTGWIPVGRLSIQGSLAEPEEIPHGCPLEVDSLGWGWKRSLLPCRCKGMWSGEDCSECLCKNGGQCTDHGCECPFPWVGPDCSRLGSPSLCGAVCAPAEVCELERFSSPGPWYGQLYPTCRRLGD